MEQIVAGVADGCRQAGCALDRRRETAEMPDFYTGGRIRSGGLHRRSRRAGKNPSPATRGGGRRAGRHGLLRRALQRLFSGAQAGADRGSRPERAGGSLRRKSWGETLLTSTKIYVKPAPGGLQGGDARHCAHHGGGFIRIPRILPDGLSARRSSAARGRFCRCSRELVKLGGLGDRQAL